MNAAEAAAQRAAYDAETAAKAAELAIEAAKPPPTDPRTPIYRALAGQEQSALARLSPVRGRWPGVADFDRRIAELERRRQQMLAEIHSLSEQAMEATNADRRVLADWTLNGGNRPEPTVPNFEERIRELRADYDASAVAVENLLAEKTAYVEKHRKRLVAEANKQTETEHAAYLSLLDNLSAARERLHDARSSALWAALYPDPSMVATMPTAIALGLAKPVGEALPGYRAQLQPERLWQLLRTDADLLRSALTTEQRTQLGHTDPPLSVWAGTPEANEQERREKQERIEAYRRNTGHDPPHYI